MVFLYISKLFFTMLHLKIFLEYWIISYIFRISCVTSPQVFFPILCLDPAIINLFKINNRNIKKRCEIRSKLTIKTPERRHWRHSGALVVNFKHISHLFLLFLLLILNKQIIPGKLLVSLNKSIRLKNIKTFHK